MWPEDWAVLFLVFVFAVGAYLFADALNESDKRDCEDKAKINKIETSYDGFWHGCKIILNDGTKVSANNYEEIGIAKGWFKD